MAEKGIEKALSLLRYLPRVQMYNVRPNPGEIKNQGRRRGQHGGTTHGHGNKGAKQRCSYTKIGYENGQMPFYLKMPSEQYYKEYRYKRQYPPLSLHTLQLMIDTGRIDPNEPIDLTSLLNSKLYKFDPFQRHFGVHLTDKGADSFTAKVNIEVQHAKETVIAAVEKNGGVITNAYYDIESLIAIRDPQDFFDKGKIIPLRRLPPEDAVEFYSDPKTRGYLADPEKVAKERFVLAQKYGYEFIDITKDPKHEMLMTKKEPKQVFFGLEPGWAVNLRDKTILRPTDETLRKYYSHHTL